MSIEYCEDCCESYDTDLKEECPICNDEYDGN